MRSTTPPDTVAGTVRAEDPDGLDSVWVMVDSVVHGEDGGFDAVFSSRFRFLVGSGKGIGTIIPISLRARDLGGFEVTRDTQVVVVE